MLEVGFQQHNNCYMIVICIYILVYDFPNQGPSQTQEGAHGNTGEQ